MIWNLLSNAIKVTPKGGKVQITVERVNSHIEMSVSDTGQGLDPEFLPHVFERFSQGEHGGGGGDDERPTRHRTGLGLGLAIVKNLAELHGGSVRAKSGGPVVRSLTAGEARHHPTATIEMDVPADPNLSGVHVMVEVDLVADHGNSSFAEGPWQCGGTAAVGAAARVACLVSGGSRALGSSRATEQQVRPHLPAQRSERRGGSVD
jgi:signal transduction histidine kinase